MSHAAALGIGGAVGAVVHAALATWSVRGARRRSRASTRIGISSIALVVIPFAVAASMPTFADALLVILGSGAGFVVALPVLVLPMRLFLAPRPKGGEQL